MTVISQPSARLGISDLKTGRLIRNVALSNLSTARYLIVHENIIYCFFSLNTLPVSYVMRRYAWKGRGLVNMGQEATLLRYDGCYDGNGKWWFLGGTNINAYDGYNPNTANLLKNFAHGATTPRGLFDMGNHIGVISAS